MTVSIVIIKIDMECISWQTTASSQQPATIKALGLAECNKKAKTSTATIVAKCSTSHPWHDYSVLVRFASRLLCRSFGKESCSAAWPSCLWAAPGSTARSDWSSIRTKPNDPSDALLACDLRLFVRAGGKHTAAWPGQTSCSPRTALLFQISAL